MTAADLAAEAILTPGLLALDTTVPVLSEESRLPAFSERRGWHRYWLVDPLDGTREFLSRSGDFSINIALIEAGRPLLGLIHLPLTGQTYIGQPGQGAARFDAQGITGLPLPSAAQPAAADTTPLQVAVSRPYRPGRVAAMLGELPLDWQPQPAGGAIKFCRIAEGSVQLYPRLAPCCEWDTAAGQALLEAIGGGVLGLSGEPLRYNQRASVASLPFVAFGRGLRAEARQLAGKMAEMGYT